MGSVAFIYTTIQRNYLHSTNQKKEKEMIEKNHYMSSERVFEINGVRVSINWHCIAESSTDVDQVFRAFKCVDQAVGSIIKETEKK